MRRSISRKILTFALAALTLAGPPPRLAADEEAKRPSRLKEPAVGLAEGASRAVEDDEVAWEKATGALLKAVEEWTPGGPLDFAGEKKTVEALRASPSKVSAFCAPQ